MSILKPLKWADISSNNPNVSIPELVRKNYQALGLRVTGGWGGGNEPFMDPDYPERQRQLNKHRSLVQVVYWFPIADAAVDLDKQIDRSVNAVMGGFDNKIPAFDYELYGPKHSITISPAELRYFTRGIFKQIGVMPYFMYAGLDWWLSPPDTGDADRFPEGLKQWVPKYRTDNVSDANPVKFYLHYLRQMAWWKRYGKRDDGKTPEAAQIGIFNEAGGPLDVNMSRVSKQTLEMWARST